MNEQKKLFIVVVITTERRRQSQLFVDLLSSFFEERAQVFGMDSSFTWTCFEEGEAPDLIFLSQDDEYLLDDIKSSLSVGTNLEKTKIVIVKKGMTIDVQSCEEMPQIFYVGGLVGAEMFTNLFGQIEGCKEVANSFSQISGGNGI
jgi:hypothetical protein